MRLLLSRRFDWYLLALALLLSAFGVLMIASALYGNAVLALYPWRQAGFLLAGLILLFAVAAIDYRLLESVAYPVYAVLLGLLVIIAVAGTVAGGAQRWLTLGEFFLQPSELTKIAVIIVLAHYLATHEEKMESILTPLGAMLLLVPAVALIYLQPNSGHSALYPGHRWDNAAGERPAFAPCPGPGRHSSRWGDRSLAIPAGRLHEGSRADVPESEPGFRRGSL